jgi:hypothetical protein
MKPLIVEKYQIEIYNGRSFVQLYAFLSEYFLIIGRNTIQNYCQPFITKIAKNYHLYFLFDYYFYLVGFLII